MKKLSTLFGLILIIIVNYSCSTSRQLAQRQVNVFYSDYSKYAKEGFMITPDMYTGNYEACGELSIEVYPGESLQKETNTGDRESVYEQSTFQYVVKEKVSGEELLKMAVDKAKEVGANALVNFKCVVVNSSYYSPALNRVVTYLSHYAHSKSQKILLTASCISSSISILSVINFDANAITVSYCISSGDNKSFWILQSQG